MRRGDAGEMVCGEELGQIAGETANGEELGQVDGGAAVEVMNDEEEQVEREWREEMSVMRRDDRAGRALIGRLRSCWT